ncbi:hypothetical protein GCM10023100_04460 [Actinocorallia cavernae]|uniref:Uncharacterized protein n=2 Tax=Actinomycetes TaxID=1760 RepID=A0ABN3L7N8_9ACTN
MFPSMPRRSVSVSKAEPVAVPMVTSFKGSRSGARPTVRAPSSSVPRPGGLGKRTGRAPPHE